MKSNAVEKRKWRSLFSLLRGPLTSGRLDGIPIFQMKSAPRKLQGSESEEAEQKRLGNPCSVHNRQCSGSRSVKEERSSPM